MRQVKNQMTGARTLENVSRSVNDLISEGGPALASDDQPATPKRTWKDSIDHLAPEVRARLMAKYSVTYNGRHYETGGYRYDSLADAVVYARLRRSLHKTDLGPVQHPENVEVPTASQRRLMSDLSITYENGVYRFGAYSYDHLSDAADYVRLQWHFPVNSGQQTL